MNVTADDRSLQLGFNVRVLLNSAHGKPASSAAQSSMRAFHDLFYSTLLAVFIPALLLMFVPRSQFQGENTTNWVAWITGAWPKMAADARWLQAENAPFVTKYVVSISTIIAVSALVFLLGSLRLVATAALNGDMFVRRTISLSTAKYYAVLTGTFLFLAYWNFLLPTPFRSGDGLSARHPVYEISFIYWAALLNGFYFVSVSFVCALAIGVEGDTRKASGSCLGECRK